MTQARGYGTFVPSSNSTLTQDCISKRQQQSASADYTAITVFFNREFANAPRFCRRDFWERRSPSSSQDRTQQRLREVASKS